MSQSECCTPIEAVPASADIHLVFERFHERTDWPLLPVIDAARRPIGIVRESEIKRFAYARFGRELVTRHALADFVRDAPVLAAGLAPDEILRFASAHPCPDGIVLANADGTYAGSVLLPAALLRYFEHYHVETEVRLVQAQKMEAIGTLAGGIAHDLNNVLTPILGYADLLQTMIANGESADPEMIEQIAVGARRARDTVRQILTFSRHQKTVRQPVRLSETVREVMRLTRPSLPATIDVDLRFEAVDDYVFANPTEMHQALMNLVTNAFHAMRERGGSLSVEILDHVGNIAGWTPGEGTLVLPAVRLTVRDTGSGIPPHTLPRVFEPFFTTKPPNEGTGMGLTVVHGIVTRSGGVVSIETAPDLGTAVHIHLPRHTAHVGDAHAVPGKNGRRALPTDTPRLRVLHVDDEYAITRLSQRVLERYGIVVDTHNDSVAALRHLLSDPHRYDALILDQTMPGMTGMELARHALAVRPELPILLCTGYSEIVSPEQARAAGLRDYVLKPPDFHAMATTLQEWFSSEPRPGGA